MFGHNSNNIIPMMVERKKAFNIFVCNGPRNVELVTIHANSTFRVFLAVQSSFDLWDYCVPESAGPGPDADNSWTSWLLGC